jgi:hypothetical protein
MEEEVMQRILSWKRAACPGVLAGLAGGPAGQAATQKADFAGKRIGAKIE